MQASCLDFFFRCTKGVSTSEIVQNVAVLCWGHGILYLQDGNYLHNCMHMEKKIYSKLHCELWRLVHHFMDS